MIADTYRRGRPTCCQKSQKVSIPGFEVCMVLAALTHLLGVNECTWEGELFVNKIKIYV